MSYRESFLKTTCWPSASSLYYSCILVSRHQLWDFSHPTDQTQSHETRSKTRLECQAKVTIDHFWTRSQPAYLEEFGTLANTIKTSCLRLICSPRLSWSAPPPPPLLQPSLPLLQRPSLTRCVSSGAPLLHQCWPSYQTLHSQTTFKSRSWLRYKK